MLRLSSLGALFFSCEIILQLAVFMFRISQIGDSRLGFEGIEEFMHRGMCEVEVIQVDVFY